MAYLNQIAKPKTPVNAEALANNVGLAIHAGAKQTGAAGRGFWQGLLGNVYIDDAQIAAAQAQTQAQPSIEDVATLVAAKVVEAQLVPAKTSRK